VCGTQGFQGSYNPLGVTDSAPGQIVWNEGSSTGNTKTCINGVTGYRLGVLSLENTPAGADTYQFVKIDGVSPNFAYNGAAIAADGKQRQQFANGSYTYALEMFSAVTPNATPDQIAFASALNTKLSDSSASDLVGIAYLDNQAGWAKNDLSNKQSRVSRAGNNCGPLLP
jgi:hypothetical protein